MKSFLDEGDLTPLLSTGLRTSDQRQDYRERGESRARAQHDVRSKREHQRKSPTFTNTWCVECCGGGRGLKWKELSPAGRLKRQLKRESVVYWYSI